MPDILIEIMHHVFQGKESFAPDISGDHDFIPRRTTMSGLINGTFPKSEAKTKLDILIVVDFDLFDIPIDNTQRSPGA
jgi:hypothetical protein